ncbi:hypothetical protein BJ165DRAFT_1309114, partial [Panaeolus papilionaceus]
MEAFFQCLLQCTPSSTSSDYGVLGKTSAYYGCIEAQGRGSLHCHMLVWLEDSLNPDELKQRLTTDDDFQSRFLSYLSSVISTEVPLDPFNSVSTPISERHPCKSRGVPIGNDESNSLHRQHDMHYLAESCQRHTHSATCYKYWKGVGHDKICRFHLDAANVVPHTTVDPDSGEIELESKDGLVNNYCKPILEALRCNMDVEFIGSGTASKAILYYITDYITKSPLKTHVGYAALETAVNKLGSFDVTNQDINAYTKDLINKCAFGMISRQEFSAQEVGSFL